MLSLKPEDEKSLYPEALKWFNARRAEIQFEVPLEELSDDDLNTFLSDDEKREFMRCKDEIAKGLYGCMNKDAVSPDPVTISLSLVTFQVNSLLPMHRIGLLLKHVHQRKVAKAKQEQREQDVEDERNREQYEAERRREEEEAEAERKEKEDSERWCAAYMTIKPPMDDAKEYLNNEEYAKFAEATWKAVEVYLERGEDYSDDFGTYDYRHWLWTVNYRKEEKRRRIAANLAAQEYNRNLNKEIGRLRSKLDPGGGNLSTYFKAKIKDKRHTSHNFDYVLSKEEEENFDRTLVRIANTKLEQSIPDSLRQFIDIPSQYYRIYYLLPSIDYSLEGIPCLNFCFDVFAAAYVEIRLRQGKKSFGDYEFHLPRIEEKYYSVLLQEPKFLGYYYLVLKPEELDGYLPWKTIPLVLLNGLLEGETKPAGVTISSASNGWISYKISKFKEDVSIPDNFASYLRSIGSIDEMVSRFKMNEKVASIVRAELGELKVEHKDLSLEEKTGGKHTKKARAFLLFSQGKRPSDSEVKTLGIKPESAYRYYQDWKKAH